MNPLTELWRQRAEDLNGQVESLLSNPLANKATIIATKAVLMPEILLALADMVDMNNAPSSPAADRLEPIRQRNQKLRMAAALGDWDEVARIGGLNYDPGGATPGDDDPGPERETTPTDGGDEQPA